MKNIKGSDTISNCLTRIERSPNVSDLLLIEAQLTKTLYKIAANRTKQKDFVLGNSLITAGQFIKEVCNFFKVKNYWQIPVPFGLVKLLAGSRLHDWDKFCMDKKHFKYNVSNAETFGFSSNLKTVEEILADLKRL